MKCIYAHAMEKQGILGNRGRMNKAVSEESGGKSSSFRSSRHKMNQELRAQGALPQKPTVGERVKGGVERVKGGVKKGVERVKGALPEKKEKPKEKKKSKSSSKPQQQAPPPKKKKGLSRKAKVGIGTAAVLGAGGLGYAAYKRYKKKQQEGEDQ